MAASLVATFIVGDIEGWQWLGGSPGAKYSFMGNYYAKWYFRGAIYWLGCLFAQYSLAPIKSGKTKPKSEVAVENDQPDNNKILVNDVQISSALVMNNDENDNQVNLLPSKEDLEKEEDFNQRCKHSKGIEEIGQSTKIDTLIATQKPTVISKSHIKSKQRKQNKKIVQIVSMIIGLGVIIGNYVMLHYWFQYGQNNTKNGLYQSSYITFSKFFVVLGFMTLFFNLSSYFKGMNEFISKNVIIQVVGN